MVFLYCQPGLHPHWTSEVNGRLQRGLYFRRHSIQTATNCLYGVSIVVPKSFVIREQLCERACASIVADLKGDVEINGSDILVILLIKGLDFGVNAHSGYFSYWWAN